MPGLLRGVARVAVVAGTATAVSNRVSCRQANRWGQQEQQQYAEQAPAAAGVRRARAGGRRRWTTSSVSSSSSATSRTQGILTDAEFEAQKAKILAG